MTPPAITDIAASALHSDRIQARIEAGEVFILRDMPQIPFLLDLVTRLAAQYCDDVSPRDFAQIIRNSALPDDRFLTAIARAFRRAREEYLGTKLLVPFVDELGLSGPVQLEAGIARVRVAAPVFERIRARTGLIPAHETAPITAPDQVPPVFALKNAPPHRDIHRPHYTTQMNLWFCLHDAEPGASLNLFPESFNKPVRPTEQLAGRRQPGETDWGLGPALRPDLRFGDALLFSSEHYHASPIHDEDTARYSWDIRLVANCLDDNGHYRKGFIPIDALRPIDGPSNFAAMVRTSLFAADHPDHGTANVTDELISQQLLCAWMDRALEENDFEIAASYAEKLLNAGPTDQLALHAARSVAPFRAELSQALLQHISERSRSFFWTLKAGETALDLGHTNLARQCLLNCETLAKATELSTAHNPVDYSVHGNQHVAQLYPRHALRRTAELLAQIRG